MVCNRRNLKTFYICNNKRLKINYYASIKITIYIHLRECGYCKEASALILERDCWARAQPGPMSYLCDNGQAV